MKKLLSVTFLSLILIVSSLSANNLPKKYYVSPKGNDNWSGSLETANAQGTEGPFATIAHARDVVRENVKTGHLNQPIQVLLRSGNYYLSETLGFTPEDSGTDECPISYSAYPGETPVISGGCNISGWTIYDAKLNIYKASVGKLQFRQIYVNGRRAIRARTPNKKEGNTLYPFENLKKLNTIDASDIDNFQNLNQVELVMSYQWHHARVRVASFSKNEGSATITPTSPESGDKTLGHFYHDGEGAYFIENAYELLDTFGEWYLNTNSGTLYYKPYPDENMANVVVTVPILEKIVEIKGTNDVPVKNLTFKGLTFEYSNWTSPNEKGYLNTQAGLVSARGVVNPGAIQIQNASNIVFENNTIKHTGSHGIVTFPTTNHIEIIKNQFTDLSASAIVIDPTCKRKGSSNGDIISNNIISYCGVEYTDACAIIATYPANISIDHNLIHDCGYSGISLGWGWSSEISEMNNNTIRYNHIYNTLLYQSDGGFIYLLGNSTNTDVAYNWGHDGYGLGNNHGIYFDEGCTQLSAHHNVLWGSGADFLVKGFGHKIFNNTLFASSNIYFDKEARGLGSAGLWNNLSLENAFVNPSSKMVDPWRFNFRLQPKAEDAVDAGVVLSANTEIFAGNAPDLGAYELNGIDSVSNWRAGPIVDPTFIISGNRGVAPFSIKFDALAAKFPSKEKLNYTWDFGDGSTDKGGSVQHTYVTDGTYKVKFTVSDSEISRSESKTVVVDNLTSLKNGLRYEYFKNSFGPFGFPRIPDFDIQLAKQVGIVSNFDLSPKLDETGFAFRFTGYIDISISGKYIFYVNADTGGKLYMDGSHLIVANDRSIPWDPERIGEIELQAGKHAIGVDFNTFGGKGALTVSYSGPGIKKQLIPDNQLYYTVEK